MCEAQDSSKGHSIQAGHCISIICPNVCILKSNWYRDIFPIPFPFLPPIPNKDPLLYFAGATACG